jgi:cytidine deaminase
MARDHGSWLPGKDGQVLACWYVAPVSEEPNLELIQAAAAVLNPHAVQDRLLGNVAAALVTSKGNRYRGVCIDTGSGTGFCAEHAAVAAMVTAGEYRIARIVAVWRDETGRLYVLPPCGRCREFIRQVDDSNIDTEVILGPQRSVGLRELLPYYEWPDPLD